MRSVNMALQRPLTRRLLPLAYGQALVIGLILLLTWGALQIQVTLSGFLNAESVWSKCQKQIVIDLHNYALKGDPRDIASFRGNYEILVSDMWARDAIASGTYDTAKVAQAFERGRIMPESVPGIILTLRYFSALPFVTQALSAWRSSDAAVIEIGQIADRLERAYATGIPSHEQITRERERINVLNMIVQPRSGQFSLVIAKGAGWVGKILFSGVFGVACLACMIWLVMARRVLAGIRGGEERYRLVFDSAADAIVMVDDASGVILDANRTAARWAGRDAGELVGQTFESLFLPTHVGDVSAFRDADGGSRPVETHSSLASWGEQTVRQAIIRDVSERMAIEQERRVASEALASIAEGVIIADAERRVISVNAANTLLTGFTAAMLIGQRFDVLRRLPDDRPLPDSLWDTIANGGNWRGEVLSHRYDGSSYPELLSISAIRDGSEQVQHYVAVFTDITRAKASQQRLEHLAMHDPLTGLINRAEFERQCTQAITKAARERGAVAVLFVDLDAFKAVNDSYSHGTGDQLLIQVAERIRQQLGPHDVAGRIGGDEFTVLSTQLGAREDAGVLGARLLAALAMPFVIGDYEVVLTASIGVAGFPLDGADTVTLIANADAAMYAAKTEERNTQRYYTPIMHADARKRLALAGELRQALLREEFRLVFQPSIELRSGRIVAVEALLRWQHPTRGEVPPAEFIPAAERLGLIRQIDEWVLRATCAQIQRWNALAMPAIRVAVNASASWFGHPAFVESVRRTLHETKVPPQRLLLEITESAILRLGEETERTMHALHALGVGVAIDDFGTGYSSLAYLKLPAVAYLKIDRSFVSGLPHNSNDVAIVEAILALSKSLGLCTIAEGIETEAQHDFLLRAGCAEGQGYLYARPLPNVDIERLLLSVTRAPPKLRLVPPDRPA
jgi:diguanylate cyclase (GGDEF)-like protein/PAS domain S-box-containing protein